MIINTQEIVGPEESLACITNFIKTHPYEVWKFQGTVNEAFEARFSSLECAVSTAMHVKGGIKSPAHTKNGVRVEAIQMDYPAVRKEWAEMKRRRLSSGLPAAIIQ